MRDLASTATLAAALALAVPGCIGAGSYEQTTILEPPGLQLGSRFGAVSFTDGTSVGVRIRIAPGATIDVAACADSGSWWPVTIGPILPLIPWPPGIVKSIKGAPARTMRLGILVGPTPQPLEMDLASVKLTMEDGSILRMARATIMESSWSWEEHRPGERRYGDDADLLCAEVGPRSASVVDIVSVDAGWRVVLEFEGAVPHGEEMIISFGPIRIQGADIEVPELRFKRVLGWTPIVL